MVRCIFGIPFSRFSTQTDIKTFIKAHFTTLYKYVISVVNSQNETFYIDSNLPNNLWTNAPLVKLNTQIFSYISIIFLDGWDISFILFYFLYMKYGNRLGMVENENFRDTDLNSKALQTFYLFVLPKQVIAFKCFASIIIISQFC